MHIAQVNQVFDFFYCSLFIPPTQLLPLSLVSEISTFLTSFDTASVADHFPITVLTPTVFEAAWIPL